MELFFEFGKPKADFAYVLIQHLVPNHKSLMDELLTGHTSLPIQIIRHNMPLERGNIYLNPSKKFVELNEGKFFLSEKEDRKLRFPISTFFNSLAEQTNEKAPVRNISGLLDLIKKHGDRLDPEKLEHYFEVIRSSSKELGQLIENLLEYSRSGKLQGELQSVS